MLEFPDFLRRQDKTIPEDQLMTDWGFSDETRGMLNKQVDRLRYDGCVDRLRRLVTANRLWDVVRTGQGVRDERVVIFENFYNTNLDRGEGQCGDLAMELFANMIRSGLWERMEQEYKAKQGWDWRSLYLLLRNGLSPTHFCRPKMNHVWVEIVEADAWGRIDRTVILDPAFRVVTDQLDGYRRKSVLCNTLEGKLSVPQDDELLVGKFDGIKVKGGSYATLGISNDRRHSLGVGFVELNSGELVPAVVMLDKKGRKASFFRHPIWGILGGMRLGFLPISEQTRREAYELIDILGQVPLLQDYGRKERWEVEMRLDGVGEVSGRGE